MASWDSVTFEEDEIVVEETKLGKVKRQERITFYRRLRTTAAERGWLDRVVPRLTTAKGSQPNPAKWKDIAAAVDSVSVPANAPASVTNAPEIVAEALYFLTTAQIFDKNGRAIAVPPLSEDEARTLMRRFRFDEAHDLAGAEAELERLLRLLDIRIGVELAVRELHGWIAEHASAGGPPVELTCDRILSELSLVARQLAIPPEAGALWRSIRAAEPYAPDGVVPERAWREVQPEAAAAIARAAEPRRLVLTGSGGMGKSRTLVQLYAEQTCLRVWVDAGADVHGIKDAIALGVWAATAAGTNLAVFVDGLDDADEPARLLADLDGALAVLPDALVVAAARPTTWAAISSKRSRWAEVPLAHWTVEHVTAASTMTPIPEDLIDLVRTPFLLDLYLRTRDVIGPDFRPASRHELVAEYFWRRVLLTNVAAKRALMTELGRNAAAGRFVSDVATEHETAMRALVDEGLLVDVHGRARFRHAILQDVCVAMALGGDDAAVCVANLDRIASRALRQDAARALIEAAMTRDSKPLLDVPPLPALLQTISQSGVHLAAIAADLIVDAVGLAAVLDAGVSLGEVARWVRVTRNSSWLTALAATPVRPRPSWLTATTHERDLYEAVLASRSVQLPSDVMNALALRFRTWATGLDPRAIGDVVAFVLKYRADAETAGWLAAMPALPFATWCGVIDGMRLIAATDANADDDTLATVIMRAHGVLLTDDDGSASNATNELVMEGLQRGKDGTLSLFETRPAVAYRVLFEAVAREGERRSRRRAARRITSPEVGRSGMTHDPDELALPPLTDDRERIVDDVPAYGWMPDIEPLHGMWCAAAHWMQTDPKMTEVARVEAKRSRSRAARNLVAGIDAPIVRIEESESRPTHIWPPDSVPPTTPHRLELAWRLLETIAMSKGHGIRWRLVEQSTLEVVLETPEVIAAAPAWALRWLSYILNAYRDAGDEPLLATWCDRLLSSLELGPIDSERAHEIFGAIAECLGGIRGLPHTLLDRFAKVFGRQFAAADAATRSKLLFEAHRPVVCHPTTTALLVEFVRTEVDPNLVAGVWLPIAEVGTAAFLAITEHLVALAPSPMPDSLVSTIGRRLGALCLHTDARAWPVVSAWLRERPASATCQRLWRPILDALAGGAALRAKRDLDRFAEVAAALWRAWCESRESHNGLVTSLFHAFHHADDERRSVMIALYPILCGVIAHGDGHDIEGIDVPWVMLTEGELERVVATTLARIAAGPPIPDEYRWFGAAIEHLIEGMAEQARLTGEQIDRFYTAVREAPWIVDHEELCVKLQTLARSARAG